MLKNQNYLDKRTGLTIPVVALAQVNTELGKATFYIGISREAIMQGNIIEKRTMFLTFDRNVNPYEYAYSKAKEPREIPVYDPQTGKEEIKIVDGVFAGWDDEIDYTQIFN
jgi:hypothetical protein